jgi:hypothetical protein
MLVLVATNQLAEALSIARRAVQLALLASTGLG